MIVAPLLLLTGMLLRARTPFFFPDQLQAVAQTPVTMAAAYSCVLAGYLTLWPGVLALAQLIGASHPRLASYGGIMVVFGLVGRIFHAGIDHLAFQVVRANGADAATSLVADSYGAFHVVATLSPVMMAGWIVLAVGAYRSGVLGLFRAVALSLMAGLMIGVLKGTGPSSIVAVGGLCVALVPLGVELLRTAPGVSGRMVLTRTAAGVLVAALLLMLGRLG
jgi:hypothetical protein